MGIGLDVVKSVEFVVQRDLSISLLIYLFFPGLLSVCFFSFYKYFHSSLQNLYLRLGIVFWKTILINKTMTFSKINRERREVT